jgi:YidC/Oxa1 family membrane protein insertase
MHKVSRSREVSSLGTLLIVAFFINLAAYSPLLAIPSPDVVVNFFASAAQVLGLVTMLLGSFIFSRKRGPKSQATGGGKVARWSFRAALVLLLLSVGANVLQYTGQLDQKNRRLSVNLVRSSTENGKGVGDVTFKTLGFAKQSQHLFGLETDVLAQYIDGGRKIGGEEIQLFDVREPEEVEMGYIENSRHSRYPDLLANPKLLETEAKKIVFLCYSGNRSSELCDEFTAKGFRCYFMVGGYEKWIAENRTLVLPPSGRPNLLRTVADFPNKGVLLDTPGVHRLVDEEGAVFVDVRYEKDFEAHHLPRGITHNIPIRKLPTQEMEAQLTSLPKKPIILACYDKRSSFYGWITGLRLHRLGYDVRGRYTVPHEYFVPAAAKAHVAQWAAANDTSLAEMLCAPLRQLISETEARVGHLALAILLCVLLLRTIILPLSLKSERDQIVLHGLAPKIAELKEKIGGDSQYFSRAVLALHKKHRVKLGRNLVGTLVQVFLWIAFFSAVSTVSAESSDSFLWIPVLSAPDPLLIFPLALAGLIFVHLQINAQKQGRRYLVLRILPSILLFAITFKLGAALNLYLVANVVLMVTQNRVMNYLLVVRPRKRAACTMLPPKPVVPLRLAHRAPGTGNKAIKLAQMMEYGFPVPDGFVVTDCLLSRDGDGDGLQIKPHERQTISRLWQQLKAEKVAVRSSGLNEDGVDRSYAGVFESVLNVTRDNFYEALEEVHASLHSSRAMAYSSESKESGGALVQKMVDAEYAGVLFTEHPAESGSMLVELVPGLGEALVSGAATPKAYRFGRVSGQPLDPEKPPIDLSALVELCRRVEKRFGQPQDIEWAFAEGKFLLLQTRDITSNSRGSTGAKNGERRIFETERHRLLELAAGAGADEAVFAQNELSELLPRPTPLSFSFMEALWAPGGSTDLACRALGIPYNVEVDSAPYLNTVFGALYVNRIEERRRLSQSPGMVASFRLTRAADSLEKEFREDFLPGFLSEVAIREIMDVSKLSTSELVRLFEDWVKRFLQETYVQAELINLAADFYFKLAERQLSQRGLQPAKYLSHMPETVVHRAMSLLPEIHEGNRPTSDFVALFGHRAPKDYELSEPRYAEDSEAVLQLVSRSGAGGSLKPVCCSTDGTTIGAENAVALAEAPKSRLLALAAERARKFQSLKEEVKHHCLRELALLRKILVELGRQQGLNDGIFFLTLNEISQLQDDPWAAAELVAERKAERELFSAYALPTEMTPAHLESLTPDGKVKASTSGRKMTGNMVAGEQEVKGPARVVASPQDIESFKEREILVARFTDPTWTPLFPKAAGIITEIGGWLSHAAIVAREYNVPAIVGVSGAMDNISTGEIVHLRLDGSIKRVDDRRRSPRRTVRAQISVLHEGKHVKAVLIDISETGARVSGIGERLSPRQEVTIRTVDKGVSLPGSNTTEVTAKVVRGLSDGSYAMRFVLKLSPQESDVLTSSPSAPVRVVTRS